MWLLLEGPSQGFGWLCYWVQAQHGFSTLRETARRFNSDCFPIFGRMLKAFSLSPSDHPASMIYITIVGYMIMVSYLINNLSSVIWQFLDWSSIRTRSCAWKSGARPTISGRVIQLRREFSSLHPLVPWFNFTARDVPTKDPRTGKPGSQGENAGKVGNVPFSNLATPHP